LFFIVIVEKYQKREEIKEKEGSEKEALCEITLT